MEDYWASINGFTRFQLYNNKGLWSSSLFTSSLIRWLWGFYMYMSMAYTNVQGDLICTFPDFNFVCNFLQPVSEARASWIPEDHETRGNPTFKRKETLAILISGFLSNLFFFLSSVVLRVLYFRWITRGHSSFQRGEWKDLGVFGET